MTDAGFSVREALPSDEDALMDVCLRTLDAGSDAADSFSNARLPGLFWAAPYLHAPGGIGFVLCRNAEVAGYVVGTADTRSYEEWFQTAWLPRVRAELEDFSPVTDGDRDYRGRIFGPRPELPNLVDIFPAHLHINLLPQARSAGWGRRLIALLCADATGRGAGGVHLVVNARNTNALAFYNRLGFGDAGQRRDGDGPILAKLL